MLCRNRYPRKKILDDEADQVTHAGGADGDHEEFQTRNQERLARQISFERADAEAIDI